MKDTDTIPNKTVVISGAAGGLGTPLVQNFAELEYNVIAVDVDNRVFSLFKDLKNVIVKTCDVTNLEQVRSLAKGLDLEEKGLDILICLTGIYDTYPVTEADPSLLKQIMAVNLFGTASLVNVFLKPLIKSGGRVIVVSSESYKIQTMFQPYMLSKAALEAYCRVARQELALKGVTLTVVRPGAIRTPLLNWMSLPGRPGEYQVYGREFDASWKMSIKIVGRITSPEKVAGKILKVSTVTKPRRIIRINNNPVLTLVSLLPVRITDWLIIKIFRIKGN
jgi:NAD(P)-dependent dehydrogenase (short-subunit alcohol dehydrogenase family)